MNALIRPFIDLLLFRGKVEDIPAVGSLLGFAALFCVLTDFISNVKHFAIGTSFVFAASQVVILAGLLKLVLALHQKPERWHQSLTALFGCLSLLNLLSLPFGSHLEQQTPATIQLTPGLILIFMIELWFFIVMARVLRETLEVSMPRAVVLGFLLSAGVGLLTLTLFGHLMVPETS